ncbi:hypothetical protein HELRODRAFT_159582 [Helobdella robusta]|uniref:Glycosyl hydrolase family 13 catalytic domain-containing protein n=1 Tax=Helobdella robusta TaxID=6412 RepID=T1EP70_HELRO|nr:hypothetical protein HELRODRAFT_159582 [Helobdella robusta]ESO12988.1 hypothetical protein HELRODRAFT_159582 [Helobdella robusta]
MEGETVELKSDVEANNVGGELNITFSKSPTEDGVKPFQVDTSDDYCGLKKEDLLKYAKDPYWVRLRIILLVLFSILWIAMLVSAIVIIVLTPKCPPRPHQEWWETAVIYQVPVEAFHDSNGDKVGDLKGLTEKLDYIKHTLKADAIAMSPIYKYGLEPTNFNYSIPSPPLGTLNDFIHLVNSARKKDLKIVLDFDFVKLNEDLKSPENKKLDDMLWNWLKLKIDGIKIINENGISNEQINHWKQLFENFTNQDTQTTQKHPKVLMEYKAGRSTNELTSLKTSTNFVPVNEALLSMKIDCKAKCVSDLVHKWLSDIGPTSKISNWMFGGSKNGRIASRMVDRHAEINGDGMLNAANLLLMTLPGSAFVYYGDEIGMKDSALNELNVNPMHWDDSSSMEGNSTKDSNSTDQNVEMYFMLQYQSAHGSGMSHLKVFQKYVFLRKEPSLKWGTLHASILKNVYFYLRKAEGHSNLLVAINFGPGPSAVNLRSGKMADKIPAVNAIIATSTYNFEGKRIDLFADGTEIDLGVPILLHAGEGIVLKWDDPKSWF